MHLVLSRHTANHRLALESLESKFKAELQKIKTIKKWK